MIESALRAAAENASLAIGGVAVLIVAWGSIEAAIGCIALVVRRQTGHGVRKAVWRRYGVWLLLGLGHSHVPELLPGKGSRSRCA
jgi:hypothetical protein